MPLHEELGQLRICKQVLVRPFAGHPTEAVKEGEGVVRVNRLGEHHLDLST
jgi:hypothetical protein